METLRDYYANMGLDENLILRLNKELRVPSFAKLTNEIHEKRLASLNQAKSELWDHGPTMTTEEITKELKSHHGNMAKWKRKLNPVYSVKGYTIGSARPGKEASSDYNRINHYSHCPCDSCKAGNRVRGVINPHDMFPYVEKNNILKSARRKELKSGEIKATPWTVEHIFALIEDAYTSNQIQFAIELMGSIMVRMAFMLDHHVDNTGVMKLSLPKLATKEMIARLPELGTPGQKVPIESVIFFLDILGFNEDIKVDVCGYRDLKREYVKGPKPRDNGRTNTMLTISHMAAVILSRRPVAEFSYGFHRGQGMNAITKGKIHPTYPLLSSNIEELLDVKLTDLGWTPQI